MCIVGEAFLVSTAKSMQHKMCRGLHFTFDTLNWILATSYVYRYVWMHTLKSIYRNIEFIKFHAISKYSLIIVNLRVFSVSYSLYCLSLGITQRVRYRNRQKEILNQGITIKYRMQQNCFSWKIRSTLLMTGE